MPGIFEEIFPTHELRFHLFTHSPNMFPLCMPSICFPPSMLPSSLFFGFPPRAHDQKGFNPQKLFFFASVNYLGSKTNLHVQVKSASF